MPRSRSRDRDRDRDSGRRDRDGGDRKEASHRESARDRDRDRDKGTRDRDRGRPADDRAAEKDRDRRDDKREKERRDRDRDRRDRERSRSRDRDRDSHREHGSGRDRSPKLLSSIADELEKDRARDKAGREGAADPSGNAPGGDPPPARKRSKWDDTGGADPALAAAGIPGWLHDQFQQEPSDAPKIGPGQRTVKIPQNCVGLILGKMGATVNEIQVQSHCDISLKQETKLKGYSYAIVTARGGNLEYLDKAEELIQAKINESGFLEKNKQASQAPGVAMVPPPPPAPNAAPGLQLTSGIQDKFPLLSQGATPGAVPPMGVAGPPLGLPPVAGLQPPGAGVVVPPFRAGVPIQVSGGLAQAPAQFGLPQAPAPVLAPGLAPSPGAPLNMTSPAAAFDTNELLAKLGLAPSTSASIPGVTAKPPMPSRPNVVSPLTVTPQLPVVGTVPTGLARQNQGVIIPPKYAVPTSQPTATPLVAPGPRAWQPMGVAHAAGGSQGPGGGGGGLLMPPPPPPAPGPPPLDLSNIPAAFAAGR